MKHIKIAVGICLCLMFMLTLMGCGEGKIIGTWGRQYSNADEWEFFEDGTFVSRRLYGGKWESTEDDFHGTWESNGNNNYTIIIHSNKENEKSYAIAEGIISNDQLTINGLSTIVLVRK